MGITDYKKLIPGNDKLRKVLKTRNLTVAGYNSEIKEYKKRFWDRMEIMIHNYPEIERTPIMKITEPWMVDLKLEINILLKEQEFIKNTNMIQLNELKNTVTKIVI